MPNSIRPIIIISLACLAQSASAQNVFISEVPGNVRLEQYTGAGGGVYLWRMPTPGLSQFPDTTCKAISIPADKPEHASRFLALYLFAKTNARQMFYVVSPANCSIVSFGMDG